MGTPIAASASIVQRRRVRAVRANDELVIDEIEGGVEKRFFVAHPPRGDPARARHEGHIPPVIAVARIAQLDLSDNLREEMQRGLRRLEVLIRKFRQHPKGMLRKDRRPCLKV
jgi:hypothetical protein